MLGSGRFKIILSVFLAVCVLISRGESDTKNAAGRTDAHPERLAPVLENNLLPAGNFMPGIDNEGVTGWQAWCKTDCDTGAEFPTDRNTYENLKLEFFDGGVTIKVLDNLLKEQNWQLISLEQWTIWPPAVSYRFTGQVKINKGEIKLSDISKPLKASPEWQPFDCKIYPSSDLRMSFRKISLRLRPGLEVSLRGFKVEPVYDAGEGRILLPGGKELRRIVIPFGAGYQDIYSAMLWRGYLWRLSGKLLPIYRTVSGGTPSPDTLDGALIICNDASAAKDLIPSQYGPLEDGGYYLEVNDSGARLITKRPYAGFGALFNYLRCLGVWHFNWDETVFPPRGESLRLTAEKGVVNPRFDALLWGYNARSAGLANGGLSNFGFISMASGCSWLWSDDICHTHWLLIPHAKFGESHPEYFALQRDGQRLKMGKGHNSDTHLCRTNDAVVKESARRVREWGRLMGAEGSYYMPLGQGDGMGYCRCGICAAANPAGSSGKLHESQSDVNMAFHNALAKEVPDRMITTLAYTEALQAPPLKVQPERNINVWYCAWPSDWPCALHADCRLNHAGVEHVGKWSGLTGGNLSFFVYGLTPFISTERFELFNRYGRKFIYFCVKDTSFGYDLGQYLASRWNWNDNLEAEAERFCRAYYGDAAGKHMLDVYRELDRFAAAYKHSEKEGGRVNFIDYVTDAEPTAIDRGMFDKLYALFGQALAAAGDSQKFRARILKEKNQLMRLDIAKYNKFTCETQDDLRAFARRAADFTASCSGLLKSNVSPLFLQSLRETLAYRCPPSEFYLRYLGMEIADSKTDWTLQPPVQELLKDPEKTLCSFTQKKGSSTWIIPLSGPFGGEGMSSYSYMCPPRRANIIRRASSGVKSKVYFPLTLDEAPADSCALSITGQDDEKDGRASMMVRVNGQTVLNGVNKFPEKGWGAVSVTIPAGVLKKGENRIDIINTTPDRDTGKAVSMYADGVYQGETSAQDYTWGWIAIADATLNLRASSPPKP